MNFQISDTLNLFLFIYTDDSNDKEMTLTMKLIVLIISNEESSVSPSVVSDRLCDCVGVTATDVMSCSLISADT